MVETTQQIVTAGIGFFGVLVGVFITALKDYIQYRYAKHRDGLLSAIRLIRILQKYVDACVDVAWDNGYYLGCKEISDEHVQVQSKEPKEPEYTHDIHWYCLDQQLVTRIISLPDRARVTKEYINFSFETQGEPLSEYDFENRQKEYALLGLDALKIIEDLRIKYKLKPELTSGSAASSDPRATLEKIVAEIDERVRARDERTRARMGVTDDA